MPALELTKQGKVFILNMINGTASNTYTADILAEYHEKLDEVEAAMDDNCALLITSSDPKFWCTGINLEWFAQQPKSYFMEFAGLMDKLFARMAMFPMPTVGCLTGHTFAGGAIFASALDFRLMNAEKGFFCFSEVDVKIPFSPKMQAIIGDLAGKQQMRELLLTGKRLSGPEALAKGVADAIHPFAELYAKSLETAEMLAGKDRATYTKIKRGMKTNLAALM